MPLVIGPRLAERLRDEAGWDVTGHPDFIVAEQPPPRWPLGQAWPPQVTVPGQACWKCIAKPLPAPLDHLRVLAR